jgi:hypothetical protein
VTACVPLAFCTLCASTHADLGECNTTRDWPLADQIPNTLLHTHERVMGTRTGHKRLLALPRPQDSSVRRRAPPCSSLPPLPPSLPPAFPYPAWAWAPGPSSAQRYGSCLPAAGGAGRGSGGVVKDAERGGRVEEEQTRAALPVA